MSAESCRNPRVARTPRRGRSAIVAAHCSASGIRSSSGTALLTRPMRSASVPLTSSPSSSSSLALSTPTSRLSRAAAPQAPMPSPVRFRCQSDSRADSAAMRRSQAIASSSAPVVHTPAMTAIEGLSRSSTRSITAAGPCGPAAEPCPPAASLRSAPELNQGRPSGRGAPVSSQTRIASSCSIVSRAKSSSAKNLPLSALATAGALMTTTATCSDGRSSRSRGPSSSGS
jgi:hypothetical protein